MNPFRKVSVTAIVRRKAGEILYECPAELDLTQETTPFKLEIALPEDDRKPAAAAARKEIMELLETRQYESDARTNIIERRKKIGGGACIYCLTSDPDPYMGIRFLQPPCCRIPVCTLCARTLTVTWKKVCRSKKKPKSIPPCLGCGTHAEVRTGEIADADKPVCAYVALAWIGLCGWDEGEKRDKRFFTWLPKNHPDICQWLDHVNVHVLPGFLKDESPEIAAVIPRGRRQGTTIRTIAPRRSRPYPQQRVVADMYQDSVIDELFPGGGGAKSELLINWECGEDFFLPK